LVQEIPDSRKSNPVQLQNLKSQKVTDPEELENESLKENLSNLKTGYIGL